MPVISVVTPVHAASVPYLHETYASLAAQQLPAGWEWQWIVQEDGQDGVIGGTLPADDRISQGSGRRGGPGPTRTLALSRARGELVKALDADDLLLPDALARDITALADPRFGWTTCSVLDLFPDGSTARFADDPPEGVLERGSVLRYWIEHEFGLPVVPGTLCIRRALLLALGGWMALPASEDTGLVLAANAVADGYFLATPGMYYRKWPGQVTQHAAHHDPIERAARTSVIRARAEALLAYPPGRAGT
ncbi:glycosyltransferase [Amycolatopsis aidingensis]|uniref:glycosyltransferase n=1 Tax=Amycolatopsis aidingensis TaxID=2842453 RepID=UPI001C0ACB3C|nr:glycosyltransferase [Amycolatopsis aidingensis]